MGIRADGTLAIRRIAVVGMDLGYYQSDTSYELTQTYHSLKGYGRGKGLQGLFSGVFLPGN